MGNWTVEGKTFNVVSSDASFSALSTDLGLWDKEFKADADTYNIYAEDNVSKVKFIPTAVAGSTITATVSKTDGTSSTSQVISNGVANEVTLVNDTTTKVVFTVIAPDQKSSKTYTVNVVKAAASANDQATLSGLTVDSLITYAATKNEYTATVANDKASVTVTPTATDNTNAKILVNGELVGSGTGKVVNLAVGENKIEVKVIAADNKTSKTYTVNVTRVAVTDSKDAALNSLTLSAGELGGFKADDLGTLPTTGATTVYPAVSLTTTVPNTVEDLTITPVTTNSKSTVTVEAKHNNTTDLEVVKNGAAYTIKGLKADDKNVVKVTVTSPDAKYTKVYELTVKRAAATASDIASLSSFKFDAGASVSTASTALAGFTSTTTSYSNTVKNVDEKFAFEVAQATGATVTATLNDQPLAVTPDNASAPTKYTATGSLKVGKNVIKVKVTSENAVNSRTYTYEVTRASSTASTDATLKEINSAAGKLALPTADTDVTASASNGIKVSKDTTEYSFTPVATNEKASISVIGFNGDQSATSKTAVTALTATKLTVEKNGGTFTVKGLKDGYNSVFVIVDAEDGSSSKVYELIVDKAAASASDAAKVLINPTFDGITLPTYDPSKTAVSVNVPFTKTTFKYTALAAGTDISAGAKAEVKVNGTVLNPATDAPLKVGANTVEITVTAENGVAKNTYTYTINRVAETAKGEAGLTKLETSAGAFDTLTLQETVTVSDTDDTATLKIPNVSSVVITPTKADPNATVTITNSEVSNKNGVTVAPNADGTFTVADLDNAEKFVITVTSENGLVTYATTVTVDKVSNNVSSVAELGNLVLSAGTLSPSFEKDKFNYEAYVKNDVATVNLTPTVSAGTVQSIEVNGVKETAITGAGLKLNPGQANVIKVNVIAADRATVVPYTITVHRAAANVSTDATLASFKNLTTDKFIDITQPTTGATTGTIAAATVATANDAFRFAVNTKDAGATVKVTAAETATPAKKVTVTKNADGTYSTAGITTGTTITVEVTAADKSTVYTYTIPVTVTP